MRRARTAGLLAGAGFLSVILTACGPRPAEEAAEAVETTQVPAAAILAPADGDTVSLPFTIRLAATGVTIAPATGAREEGIAHHHLLFNVELARLEAPIPADEGYVHLGSGVSEYVVEELPPGVHQIVAILAWGDHVPITGAVKDTVRVVVRP